MRCLQGTQLKNLHITTQGFLKVFENSARKWEWLRENEVVWVELLQVYLCNYVFQILQSKYLIQQTEDKSIIKIPMQGLFLSESKRQRLFLCENEMVNSHMISLCNSLTVINCICTNCDSEEDFFRGCLGKKC